MAPVSNDPHPFWHLVEIAWASCPPSLAMSGFVSEFFETTSGAYLLMIPFAEDTLSGAIAFAKDFSDRPRSSRRAE